MTYPVNFTIRSLTLASVLALAMSASPARAAEVIIAVSGVGSPDGEIDCALFSGPSGFPREVAGARQQAQPPKQDGVVCRFDNLKPGRYAAAVLHDMNGNRRLDTNLVGLPTEDWGVSNNIRHTLSPPTFEEAAFEAKDGAPTRITIRLGR